MNETNERTEKAQDAPRMAGEKEALFSSMPVPKAIAALAVPTVISQLITVVYNMADTFFVGQLGDPDQVAAATITIRCSCS